MLFHLGQSKALAGIMVICAVLGATLFVAPTTALKVTFQVETSPSGAFIDFNILAVPLTVGFSVKSSAPGSAFFWQFGDGTNSSEAAPSHTFGSACVYYVHVQVTAGNGSITSGEVILGAFDTSGQSGRALAVCPPQGTAGLIPVELAGGYFPANKQVNVLMNGTSIATVTADRGGDWVLNVSGFLTPEPNGTQYAFTTSPVSLTRAFTTLEGVRGTPVSGAPGTSVLVDGRSYPPYSSVQVYLAGVSLGTAQTDADGSFLTAFQIPYANPLTSAGTYPYSTIPTILGSQANFTSKGNAVAGLVFSWWWWLLLIVLFLVAAYLVRRRMKRRAAPPAQG